MLHRRDARYLRTLRWRRPSFLVLGLLLMLGAGAYGTWSVERLRSPAPIALPAPPWDPAAGITRLFTPYDDDLRRIDAANERELALLAEIQQQNRATGRLVSFVVRIALSSLAFGAGLLLLGTAISQGRLLAIVDLLQKAE